MNPSLKRCPCPDPPEHVNMLLYMAKETLQMCMDLEMGETMLDYLDGPNEVTREAKGSESEKRCNLKRVCQKEWVKDSTLLTLKMVEGASSPGMYMTSRSWKRQRNGFFLRIPGGNKALLISWFQPAEDQKTFNFQNCKVIKFCVTTFVVICYSSRKLMHITN